MTATMDDPTPLDVELRDRYLARLGFDAVPEPTLDTLFAVHRAQVERVPYETIWIAVGGRRTIDPVTTIRIFTDGSGSGGYCYHLNGACSLLLEWLGFEVHRHFGGVQSNPSAANPTPAAGASGNHLAVTVDLADGSWLVDTGLGDGPYEPLPLVASEFVQPPFRFALRPSEANPGGWRFDHDPAGSFAGFDFRPGPVGVDEFEERHRFLMTSPESGFVRVVMAQRRDAGGFDSLRGKLLSRIEAVTSPARELTTVGEWRTALADVFGITLARVEEPVINAVWEHICRSHDAFLGAQDH